jgi:sensor c-di-GMP phosphodiesterase-like protein
MKGTIEEAGVTTRQLLEDVQASLHDSIAGEAILKCYTDETRQQFAAVVKTIIESTLTRALTLSQERMDDWVRKSLDQSIREAQNAVASATANFRAKLGGAWGRLLWACIGGGLIAGALLLVGGFWLGRNW